MPDEKEKPLRVCVSLVGELRKRVVERRARTGIPYNAQLLDALEAKTRGDYATATA